MANPKFSSHARSTSWPSSSHPLLGNAVEHLQRLKSSEGASSSSQESTCQKLDGLKNLYEYLEDVLQLSHSQRILSNSKRCGEWEEGVLDGSLRILDICGEVREIYSQMKENVQELESSLRRKRSGEFTNEVGTYMISKKHLSKMICKCFKELKKAEKNGSLAVLDDSSDAYQLINLIKEIQHRSIIVLDSTLSFISQSMTVSQTKGWSLVSKFIQQKAASCERNSDIAAFEKIELQLHLLKKSDSPLQMQNVLKQLETINSSIQESQEVLEAVFRQLLKTRVSLLNILTH